MVVYGHEFDADVVKALESTGVRVFGGEVVWSAPRILHGYVTVKGRARDFRRADVVKYISGARIEDDVYLVMLEIYLYESEMNELRDWKERKLPGIAQVLKQPSSIGVSGIDALRSTGNKLLVKLADILDRASRGMHTYKDLMEYFDILIKIYSIDPRLFSALTGEEEEYLVESFKAKYENVWKPLYEKLGENMFGVKFINIGLTLGSDKRIYERRLHGKIIRSKRFGTMRRYGVLLYLDKDMEVIDRDTAGKFYALVFEELRKIVEKHIGR